MGPLYMITLGVFIVEMMQSIMQERVDFVRSLGVRNAKMASLQSSNVNSALMSCLQMRMVATALPQTAYKYITKTVRSVMCVKKGIP